MKFRKFKRIFKINDLVDLRLVKKRTYIFINNKPALICALLENQTSYDWYNHFDQVINSVISGRPPHYQRDEVVEILIDQELRWQEFYFSGEKLCFFKDFETLKHYKVLYPKEEFQNHCSNVQMFFENGLNTDLLHSNIALPLLKELVNQGFEPARKVFKEEIAIRFNEGTANSRKFLMKGGYLDYLNSEEKQALRGYNE